VHSVVHSVGTAEGPLGPAVCGVVPIFHSPYYSDLYPSFLPYPSLL
jgi:hypothetical protein